jgi:hypothetical protein
MSNAVTQLTTYAKIDKLKSFQSEAILSLFVGVEATAALLLNEFSAEECSTMFPESPTKDFASKARLIAEGYRKAR